MDNGRRQTALPQTVHHARYRRASEALGWIRQRQHHLLRGRRPCEYFANWLNPVSSCQLYRSFARSLALSAMPSSSRQSERSRRRLGLLRWTRVSSMRRCLQRAHRAKSSTTGPSTSSSSNCHTWSCMPVILPTELSFVPASRVACSAGRLIDILWRSRRLTIDELMNNSNSIPNRRSRSLCALRATANVHETSQRSATADGCHSNGDPSRI